MSEKNLFKDDKIWMKITAAASVGILLVVLVVGVRLNKVMDEFDEGIKLISDTVVLVNDTIESLPLEDSLAQLDQATRELTDVSAQLADIDWQSLEKNINDTAITAQNSMQSALKMIDDLDIETLNGAISDLREVVGPLLSLVRLLPQR